MDSTPADDRLYSTADVARRLQLSPAHVRRLAARLGVGVVLGRSRVFTAVDVARLEARRTQVGRPPTQHTETTA